MPLKFLSRRIDHHTLTDLASGSSPATDVICGGVIKKMKKMKLMLMYYEYEMMQNQCLLKPRPGNICLNK